MVTCHGRKETITLNKQTYLSSNWEPSSQEIGDELLIVVTVQVGSPIKPTSIMRLDRYT